jgi:hypothetical protein
MASTWIELARVVVDLVKAVAWPTVVVALALKFKPELLTALPSLFRRKVEVEALGFRAMIDAAAEQQQLAAPGNPSLEKLSGLTPLEPSPRLAVNLIENRLRGELEAMDPGKRDGSLLRSFAQTRLAYAHELTYNRIFGSQIAFLKRLNEISTTTVDHSREFFKPYAEKFPEFYATYTFEAWLNFLVAGGLVTETGSSLVINDYGRDFLIYMVEHRLLENKPW